MPIYHFTATNEREEVESGQIDAVDSRAAREELAVRGLRAETLAVQQVPSAAAPGAPLITLSGSDSLELTTHLAGLLKANVPLAPGLRALAEELPNRKLSKAFRELADRLTSGAPLDAAVVASVGHLPPYVRGLLAASLTSDRYREALEDYLGHEQVAAALRHRLWLAISYPLLLTAIIAAWFLLIVFIIIPPFKAIYLDFKLSLPAPTVLLLRLADSRVLLLVGAMLFVLLLGLAPWFAARFSSVSSLLDRVPIVGPLWRYRALARFSNLLAVLLEQGVPLPVSLELTASGVGHPALANACRRSARRIAEGRKLSESIAEQHEFPAVLVPILAWGERLSAVPEALHTAAAMFRSRIEQRAPFAAIALPALSFLVVISVIFLVIAALFSPLINLITDLSQ